MNSFYRFVALNEVVHDFSFLNGGAIKRQSVLTILREAIMIIGFHFLFYYGKKVFTFAITKSIFFSHNRVHYINIDILFCFFNLFYFHYITISVYMKLI